MRGSFISTFIAATLFCLSFAGESARSQTRPPFRFREVSQQRGIQPFVSPWGMGSGISAVDVDEDGDIDVFVPNGEGAADQLYLNDGKGSFQEVAAQVGLNSTDVHRNGFQFDYDNDGDLDLLMQSDGDNSVTALVLMRHESNGQYTDVTQTSGVFGDQDGHRGGLCAGDINNDGFLDFYASEWQAMSRLYLNNRDGTFTDISASSGILKNQPATQWMPMMNDYNLDGWIDIYVCVDFFENLLFINQGNNTFVDVAQSVGADIVFNDMGQTVGDFDNDGDFDIYTTNVWYGFYGNNALLRNDSTPGNLLFTEVANQLGVGDGSWGWGTTFFDPDNDGWLDIGATNGFFNAPYDVDTTRLFWNSDGPNLKFSDVAKFAGVNDNLYGSCLIAFDLERDGDLDLMQVCVPNVLRLLSNEPFPATQKRSDYLVVQPRKSGDNHWAVGTVVELEANGQKQMRLITAGTSFQGQEPYEAFFGLGKAERPEVVRVKFADGRVVTLRDVAANQQIVVAPPPCTDLVVEPGVLTQGDVLDLEASDDVKVKARSQSRDGTQGVDVRVGWVTDVVQPKTIGLAVETSTNDPAIIEEIRLRNWTSGTLDEVGTRHATTVDSLHSIKDIPATDYVNADGRIEVHVVHQVTARTPKEFTSRIDWLVVSVK